MLDQHQPQPGERHFDVSEGTGDLDDAGDVPFELARLQRRVVDADRDAVDDVGGEAGGAGDGELDVLGADRDGAVSQVLGLDDDPAVEVEDLDGHAGRGEGVQVREADEDVDARLGRLAAQVQVDGAAQLAGLVPQVVVDLAFEVVLQREVDGDVGGEQRQAEHGGVEEGDPPAQRQRRVEQVPPGQVRDAPGRRPRSVSAQRSGHPGSGRHASPPGRSLSLAEHVAGVPDGVDQARLAADFELGAELADVDRHQVRLALEVVPPDLLQDVGVGEDPPRVAHEEVQEVVLLAGQPDGAVGAASLAGAGVQHQVGEAQEGGGGGAGGGRPGSRRRRRALTRASSSSTANGLTR